MANRSCPSYVHRQHQRDQAADTIIPLQKSTGHKNIRPAYRKIIGCNELTTFLGEDMPQVKYVINKFLKKVGLQLQRARPTREDFLLSRGIDTVVDVGANLGQFGRELRRSGYSGRIISFEPINDVFQGLLKEIGDDPTWYALNYGVSDYDGTSTINVSEHTVFSSLHERRGAAEAYDKRSAFTRIETITLRTLDGLNSEIGGSNLFLKIDTQGHEHSAMRSVGKLLDRIQGIQLELPISQLYEGNWSIGESLEYMRRIGFVPTMFTPVNYHLMEDPMAIVEVDCIFRRINPQFD